MPSNKCFHGLSEPPHPRSPNAKWNKLHIHECICTSCSEHEANVYADVHHTWLCARSWLSSTTADRHLVPSPEKGGPQTSRERVVCFPKKIKFPSILWKIVIFKLTKIWFFTNSLASWPEFIVVVRRQYKPFRTHTLKLAQTSPVPACTCRRALLPLALEESLLSAWNLPYAIPTS